jgi:CHRD domain
MTKYTIGSFVTIILALGVITAQASAHQKPGHAKATQAPAKMWVCHRAGDNKYVAIRVSSKAQMRGHLRHGDVAVPAASTTTKQTAQTFCNTQTITPRRGGEVLTGNLTGTAGTGMVTLRLSVGHRTACFTFSNLPSGFTFSLAHVHSGSATGPIVLPLTSTGQTSGCVTGIDRGLLRQILQNPAGFTVNLHLSDGTVILSAPLSA